MQTSAQQYQLNVSNSTTFTDTIATEQNKIAPKKIFDGTEVGNQFVQYFYSTWMTNIDVFISDNIIKPYTKIVHNNVTYEGNDFIVFLKSVATNGLEFSQCKWEIIDSGSRQIYILVTGQIVNAQGTWKFSQSFTLAFGGQTSQGTKLWVLINSIFIL